MFANPKPPFQAYPNVFFENKTHFCKSYRFGQTLTIYNHICRYIDYVEY